MAYILRKEPESKGPYCKCRKGSYSDEEFRRTGRYSWFQVTSHCKIHWPLMTWGQKLNIIRNENILGGFE